jgi:hypothetical protein
MKPESNCFKKECFPFFENIKQEKSFSLLRDVKNSPVLTTV